MLSSWRNLALGGSLAFLAGLMAPAITSAQAVEDDPDRVSNDQPTRPMQMPAASSEVKEAFEDFARFQRRGAWERATKALYAIPDAQIQRFVDGENGFIIPVGRKRHAVLTGLSIEGLAAYRLFYDTDAKKLLDQAEGPAEQATLEKLYSAYFLTTVGAHAADRLGDLYFEQGRFDRAADCYLAVFRERPDSDLAPALLAVKAAIALTRAGRRTEAQAIRAEVIDRYKDEVVTVGGRKAKAIDHLRNLGGGGGDAIAASKVADLSASATASGGSVLLEPVAATWQVRFGASVMAGMTPPEARQWEENGLSYAVPPISVAAATLFANYLGHVFAVDLSSGKMLWRSGSWHNVEVPAMADQARTIDPGRYAILAGLGYVWSLSRDLKDPNYQATAHLVCRRAENGEVAWESKNLPDYAGLDLVGLPILTPTALLIAGKSAPNNNGQERLAQQVVLAIRPHDGKLLWKTEVGTFREAQQYFYYAMRDNAPQPRLTYHAGSVYIDTHVGVMARLDAESGKLDWGYGYRTEAIQGQSRFFFRMQPQSPTPLGAAPLVDGGTLLIKGARSERIAALDPDRMTVVWDRPIAKASRLLGVDETSVYLGGPDLNALDRKTKALQWSLPLPGGSEEGQVLLRADALWQLTPRGIFEVDPKTGRVRRIFRGDDAAGACGDLVLTDRWLVAVSNRTISAYPRGTTAADRAAGPAAAELKTRGSDD